MPELEKIDCESIKEGVRFSAPVFFDDGKNMFLAEKKPAKPYHVAALKRWKIPFLLSYGHPLGADEDERRDAVAQDEPPFHGAPLEEAEEVADDVGELEELEPID